MKPGTFLSAAALIRRTGIFLMLAAAGYGWFFFQKEHRVRPEPVVPSDEAEGGLTDVRPAGQKLTAEGFHGLISARDPFNEPRPPDPEPVSSVLPEVPQENIAEKFKIVGLVRGTSPQVVIEDREAMRTSFLEPGVQEGDFLLQKIEGGNVHLKYKDAEYIISLNENASTP
jgi:hypothetical protein